MYKPRPCAADRHDHNQRQNRPQKRPLTAAVHHDPTVFSERPRSAPANDQVNRTAAHIKLVSAIDLREKAVLGHHETILPRRLSVWDDAQKVMASEEPARIVPSVRSRVRRLLTKIHVRTKASTRTHDADSFGDRLPLNNACRLYKSTSSVSVPSRVGDSKRVAMAFNQGQSFGDRNAGGWRGNRCVVLTTRDGALSHRSDIGASCRVSKWFLKWATIAALRVGDFLSPQ